jgi:radical SAM-linked protein
VYKVNFIFTKQGFLKYISHLDLMRLLQRAMRRAGLPLKMTQGFSPHPKLSLQRALKLGLESEHEEASILLKEPLDAAEFKARLQRQLPQGLTIKNAQGNFSQH